MSEGKELIVQNGQLSIEEIKAQVAAIQVLKQDVLKEKEHYGTIPGVEKPSLWKSKTEKLCLTFRLDPQYDSTETYDGEHLTVKSKCTLYYIPTGARMGSGEGSCSTKESKYAYRKAGRTCPSCGKEGTIIKGKKEYGGGWLCWKEKGGCGVKFTDGDVSIENQVVGRVPNEDLADQYNTVLKMANKRSLIAAVLNVTAASDIFTQDIEDFVSNADPELTERKTTASVVPEKTAEPVQEEFDFYKDPITPVQKKSDKESKALLYAQLKEINQKNQTFGPLIIADLGGNIKTGYEKITVEQAQMLVWKYEIKHNLTLPATKDKLPAFLKETSFEDFLKLPFDTARELYMRYGN